MIEALCLYARVLKELHTTNPENSPELLVILTDAAPIQLTLVLHAEEPTNFSGIIGSRFVELFEKQGLRLGPPVNYKHLRNVLSHNKYFNGATWSFVPAGGIP